MPFHGVVGAVHRAVYWPFLRYGKLSEAVYTTGVEIAVRWDDREQWGKDAKGNKVKVDGCVAQLDRALIVHSLVWKGTLAAVPSSGLVTGLREIVSMEEAADRRGRNVYREADFMRFRDVSKALLPTPSGTSSVRFLNGNRFVFLNGNGMKFLHG